MNAFCASSAAPGAKRQRSSAPDVVLYRNFAPSELVFGNVEKYKSGGRYVPVVWPDGSKRRVCVQTPVLELPFGVSTFENRENGMVKLTKTLDVSPRNMDNDPKQREFLEKMAELDRVVVDAGFANSKAWFQKEKSRDVVADNLRKLFKENDKYPPVMKIKIPVTSDGEIIALPSGEPKCTFEDKDRNPVSIDYVTRNSKVRVIMEADRVWFAGTNSFGITWTARHVRVMEKEIDKFEMLDDDDDEAPAEEAEAVGSDVGRDDDAMIADDDEAALLG